MKATYRVTDPRLLLEASPGELFTTLGPHLVECVCAIRSRMTIDGVQPELEPHRRMNPEALVPVVVLACRADPGEPEYYPAGFEIDLPAASPIVFLALSSPVLLTPKEARGEESCSVHVIVNGFANQQTTSRL